MPREVPDLLDEALVLKALLHRNRQKRLRLLLRRVGVDAREVLLTEAESLLEDQLQVWMNQVQLVMFQDRFLKKLSPQEVVVEERIRLRLLVSLILLLVETLEHHPRESQSPLHPEDHLEELKVLGMKNLAHQLDRHLILERQERLRFEKLS